MRYSTTSWAKFESKGRPGDTKKIHGTNREILLEFAKWFGDVYMGSHLKVIVARTEEELESITSLKPHKALDVDMLAELDSFVTTSQGELLDGADRPNPHMPESETHNET